MVVGVGALLTLSIFSMRGGSEVVHDEQTDLHHQQNLNGRSYTGDRAPPLQDSDFVHAIPTSQSHEHLALEGRIARMSRAFLVTNYTVGDELRAEGAKWKETWGFYPDDRPLRTFALFGDSRAALAPFLAHKHFGDSYKWLLYGDDDTLFFPHALKRTLHNLDPNIPYFLTDHMWWTEHNMAEDGVRRPDKPKHDSFPHPHAMSPRCVPCNYRGNTSGLPFKMPPGCPCTPEFGYGMTDIDPLWHPDGQPQRTMFDVGKISQTDHEDIRIRVAVVLRTHLLMAAGVCFQELEWDHTLTLHMRSRWFPTHMAHAEVMRVLVGLAAIWKGDPNPFEAKAQVCIF
ncbi:hypothetical protein WJX73_008989 [Symbiochloris irregularis]|uniref:Hexosyltransferase n=1 Tax=Symbiochloris irregularis TaxID=706552 RepID=A0AAW1P136_9CHLO